MGSTPSREAPRQQPQPVFRVHSQSLSPAPPDRLRGRGCAAARTAGVGGVFPSECGAPPLEHELSLQPGKQQMGCSREATGIVSGKIHLPRNGQDERTKRWCSPQSCHNEGPSLPGPEEQRRAGPPSTGSCGGAA